MYLVGEKFFFHLSEDVITPEQNMGLLSPRYLCSTVVFISGICDLHLITWKLWRE